jgi:PP-loop superfamily ATP-utilizing enzyme
VQPSLGRVLSANAANVTVGLTEPGSMFNDRANQLDLRMAKLFRFGARRVTVNLDIYNALNRSPVLLQNNNFAVWQLPQKIMDPRLFKISGQFDF